MARDEAYLEAEKKIQEALNPGATKLDLSEMKLTELPESLGQLTQLTNLNLSSNQLTALPESLGQLTQLTELNLSGNQLTTLPDSLGKLTQLQKLDISHNKLTTLPNFVREFSNLYRLDARWNQLTELPQFLFQLPNLEALHVFSNPLSIIPREICHLTKLKELNIGENQIDKLPDEIWQFANLRLLVLDNMPLATIPPAICQLTKLEHIELISLQISELPSPLVQLEHLKTLNLAGSPINPFLRSAYMAGLDELKAYLSSLENAKPLYEAKLVLVGEGNAGKTTLLKALKGKKGAEAPKKSETTTHGVEIDIDGLMLPHPEKDGVEIQLNAWDFGGQDVYRVTHQFFFSRRSLYLVIWEPRRGVQAGQVEDWLNMIRLRVGEEARVLIVSTHCKTGERIARIDKPVLQQQYGEMIVGFYEVDSLVPDEQTGEMVGIAELKKVIAEQAAQLEHVGVLFSPQWKAARDELINYSEARISYTAFSEICAKRGLSPIATKTLAQIMHDLGYIVHYSEDEKLCDDVVLKPQWLTKAIGFVLEDRYTQENEGILPDQHLAQVWRDHPFDKEPRYEPFLYPFFLRLMEKYDVSYRLPEERHASLVAQHVPQVRPELPWLPEDDEPANLRRIAMICAMEEDPPGLVPWMIVRTHDYAVEQNHHRLHWQKGMFLRHGQHGEAMLEKRGREFHVYAQADWPQYLMTILQHTLEKLIKDNWPGMEGRYRFAIPCPTQKDGKPCPGRFNLNALREFLAKGAGVFPCQECYGLHSISDLLMGFEERSVDQRLREVQEKLEKLDTIEKELAGLNSRIADYFMATMNAIADEAKHGPRLFTFRQRDADLSLKRIYSKPVALQLWCEAEGCQHPVIGSGNGLYPIDLQHEWVKQIAPYANFVLKVLATVAPMAAPAINTFFGAKTTETWKIDDQLSLAGAIIGELPDKIEVTDHGMSTGKMLSQPERSGILALHRFLNEVDPTQEKLGLHRVSTYTGDYRWLCQYHYEAWQPKIPDVIQSHAQT